MSAPPEDKLAAIFARKRRELAARGPRVAAHPRPAPRDFTAALTQPRPGQPINVIAEVKRRSPSGGDFPHTDLVAVARGYEAAGASALSVLTDDVDFGGCLEDLLQVREATGLPVLRKDFLVSPQEVEESAALGADAILLIADALEDGELREMVAAARASRVAALVEAHTQAHAERALQAGAELVGLNNRDLATLRTDTTTALRVIPLLRGRARAFVAESGLKTPEDFRAARAAGAHAVLVGESLLRDADPGRALARLLAPGDAP
ncbi:indole-3-glycerol phosphate synthase TrpC [Archangium primigenium]|uniref:indole-3-glycerol phosphate synthase TrpC n=1 Tax=[Archangium] primigenium TaxID=2792470 RepID=UPI001959E9F9|nr:indole-3-glycerol-phosphate synthase [Archangium primigenium]